MSRGEVTPNIETIISGVFEERYMSRWVDVFKYEKSKLSIWKKASQLKIDSRQSNPTVGKTGVDYIAGLVNYQTIPKILKALDVEDEELITLCKEASNRELTRYHRG